VRISDTILFIMLYYLPNLGRLAHAGFVRHQNHGAGPEPELPALIAGAGERVALRFLEFFTVNIRNRKNTRPALRSRRRPPQRRRKKAIFSTPISASNRPAFLIANLDAGPGRSD
jgi:hypothetical protein